MAGRDVTSSPDKPDNGLLTFLIPDVRPCPRRFVKALAKDFKLCLGDQRGDVCLCLTMN